MLSLLPFLASLEQAGPGPESPGVLVMTRRVKRPIEELPGGILERMTVSLPCSDISLAEYFLEQLIK